MDAAAKPSPPTAAVVIRDTVQWLERAVIGLNLCPFAKGVHAKGLIHYAVTPADDPAGVLAALRSELAALDTLSAQQRDTTLLLLANCLQDFLDFNDFLGDAEALLEDMGLAGTLQIASFHPRYQFAGTAPDDMGNCSNRAPYPCLHLLREESLDRAVATFPEPQSIFERNIQVLEALGMPGWLALDVGPSPPGAR
ncbi:DUF1415 domain-containing protein [Verminephrobacter aporrectodeae subsp. tuberculatae]|uniref:DUF1415 domain-containing protein n=1 Tax=Verminephrobacter aporrectodeae subsp. tuberculatae TaxID=1110392 RepID=A0ABT3KVS5_9BURK|nr:DUF1415 domain-containing protein [Verminephrobacter aporrectodeae]MCW5322443.1 DUF1415 domain-containing protein [Verminephrobacter aporrectodeae subsp. tuberculatae]MCW8166407.1 DUF1415 domain-containing protein [Verminephrobacter aporrectodeae subsp. tuberculatae]MCW8168525.1 DUF1415 domain-containing protein [Verminephrobacter aporrectodeae subsp. tuberculatae]MCW8207949.1 DUF1415 domain-containing protein [Verminephrobacter aporrectodeae subsp. tuberculatae]